jgi:hypothetical protein
MKSNRAFRLVLTVALVVLSLAATLFASARTVTAAVVNPLVYIDGEKAVFTDATPVIESGRTLVPLRAIFEKLGAEVEWIEATDEVFARKNGRVLHLYLPTGRNSKPEYAELNGQSIDLSGPRVRLVNGRTLVGLRLVAEGLNAKVDWYESENAVRIVTVPDVAKPPTEEPTDPTYDDIARQQTMDDAVMLKKLEQLNRYTKMLDDKWAPIIGQTGGVKVTVYGYEGNVLTTGLAAIEEPVLLDAVMRYATAVNMVSCYGHAPTAANLAKLESEVVKYRNADWSADSYPFLFRLPSTGFWGSGQPSAFLTQGLWLALHADNAELLMLTDKHWSDVRKNPTIALLEGDLDTVQANYDAIQTALYQELGISAK